MSFSLPHHAGAPSFVLHERARAHHHEEPAGTGRLSVKCMVRGEARYEVGRARHLVRPGEFLVLNAGSPYAVDIRSRGAPVESLCVFFGDGLAADVLRSLTLPEGRLLDRPRAEPLGDAGEPLRFGEHLHALDAELLAALRALRPSGADEGLRTVLDLLVRAHRLTTREAAPIPAARASTRAELLRRVRVARDYLDASLESGATLDELARAAAMSPHHLLRTFRHAFRETPHQYLIRRRLERAAELLREGAPVSGACAAVGFESVGSFSALFKRRFGTPPSRWKG